VIPNCSYTGPLIELTADARFWTKARRKTKEYTTKHVSIPDPPKLTISLPKPVLLQVSTREMNTLGVADVTPESEEPMAARSPSLAHSLPNSDFKLNCHCGVQGDGNVLYRTDDDGAAVKCDECGDWSHIACQRDGRASLLKPKDEFICNCCDALNVLHPRFHQKERESRRK
jgi:hypothetical protein